MNTNLLQLQILTQVPELNGEIIMLFKKLCQQQKVLGIALSITLLLFILPITFADNSTPRLDENAPTRLDENAPIGVIATRGHKTGDVMYSFRGTVIGFQALQSDIDMLKTLDVQKDYGLVPEYMITSTQMHSAIYTPHDHITLMAIINYHEHIMQMEGSYQQQRVYQNQPEGIYKLDSEGFGDIKFDTLLKLLRKEHFIITGNIGISLPTGSTVETGDDGQMLPYPMQLGSGSYEARPGVTLFGTREDWSYGGQLLSSLPLHQNAHKYRHGNTFTVTAWSTQRVNNWFQFGGRLLFSHKTAFSSSDPKLNQNRSSIYQIDSQGNTQLDIALSTDFIIPTGTHFQQNRLAFEIQVPVYQNQNLTGIQLINRLQFTAGASLHFR